jgi:hypothetical protein
MAANVQKQILCQQVTATVTSGATPIFLGGVKRVKLRTLTNDVYVDFDQPVAPTTAYRVAASNTADTEIETEMGLISNLYVQATTGTSVVYIISIAG